MTNYTILPNQAEIAKDLQLSLPTISMIVGKLKNGEDIGKYELLLFHYQQNRSLLMKLEKYRALNNLTSKHVAQSLGYSYANYRMKLTALRRGKRPQTFIASLEKLLK